MPPIAKRIHGIRPSDIRKWTSIIEGGGINLAPGSCFIEPSEEVLELILQTWRAMDEGRYKTGVNSYSPSAGIGPLREAIAKKCHEFNRIQANPGMDGGAITVTPGGTADTLNRKLSQKVGLPLKKVQGCVFFNKILFEGAITCSMPQRT